MPYKKYSMEMIKEMRALRIEWKTLSDIATMFDCWINTVYKYTRDIKKEPLSRKEICENYYQRHKERLKKQALDRYYKNK